MFHGLSRPAWTYSGPLGTQRQPTGSCLGAGNLAYLWHIFDILGAF